jgi:Putative addiction module component
MTIEQLENEVFALPKDSQTALIARLLARLGENAEINSDMANTWAEEAEQRDRQLDEAQNPGIPAEDVFRRVRESLQ